MPPSLFISSLPSPSSRIVFQKPLCYPCGPPVAILSPYMTSPSSFRFLNLNCDILYSNLYLDPGGSFPVPELSTYHPSFHGSLSRPKFCFQLFSKMSRFRSIRRHRLRDCATGLCLLFTKHKRASEEQCYTSKARMKHLFINYVEADHLRSCPSLP